MAREILTVADLVAHLLTLPQDYPVTGFNGAECTSAVTLEGVRVYHDGEDEWSCNMAPWWRNDAHVDIMGI